MVLESHQHFWLVDEARDSWITPKMEAIRRDFLPEDLHNILLENKVDGCIAVQTDQSAAETDFLLQIAEAHEFVCGVVGWVDFLSDSLIHQLEDYSQFEKLKGFRHITQGQPDGYLIHPQFVKGVSTLAAFDYSYDILIYPNQLKEAYLFASQIDNVRFVLDHIAKPYIKVGKMEPWETDIRRLAQLPHVYCKISGMVTEAKWDGWHPSDFKAYLDVVFDAFGVDRLMFGSDWPVCLVASDYGNVKNILHQYLLDFSDLDRKKIWGLNAKAFYKIE
jgi:L-fuconolactonase